MKKRFALVSAVAAMGLAAAVSADFYSGQELTINGDADGQFATSWGSWVGQGPFFVDGPVVNVPDPGFPTFSLNVSAALVGAQHLQLTFDYTGFAPGDFPNHFIDILDLKGDFSIIDVTANLGSVFTDGNSVFWSGAGSALAASPILVLDVYQVPAPGALALLGLAGLSAARRRRH